MGVRGRIRPVLIAVGVLAAALAIPSAGWGASIPVTTQADIIANDGLCSLREAITAANTDNPFNNCPTGAGQDTVELAAGTFTLSLAGPSEDSNLTGDLDLTSQTTVAGAGSSATTIDGGGIDRVLNVRPSGNVTVQQLTIRGGRAPAGVAGTNATGTNATGTDANGGTANAGTGATGSSGGGILNQGSLTVTAAVITDNRAGDGGAGGNATGGAGGIDSSGNGRSGGLANGGGAGNGGTGGGIHSTGTLTIATSTLAGNRAGTGGRGGGATGGRGGNGVGQGHDGGTGGLSLPGPGGNGGNGGAVAIAGGSLTLTDSTVADNNAGAGGLGGAATGGAAGDAGRNDLTTFTGEDGRDTSGGQGGAGGASGGIHGGDVYRDSTFSGNAAGAGGQGGPATGGAGGAGSQAVDAFESSGNGGDGGDASGGHGGTAGDGGAATTNAFLIHATVASNSVGAPGAAGTATGGAGGPPGDDCGPTFCSPGDPGATGSATPGTTGGTATAGGLSGNTLLRDTVIAGNAGLNCTGSPQNLGSNISYPDASCPGANGDPLLGALQDNGGPTATRGLGAGSSAIDNASANCTSTDQRGIPRPQGSACDIGAYEVAQPTAATGSATDVGLTSATLHGTVTPRGRGTVRFEYGTAATYGSTTSGSVVSAEQDVAEAVAGLDPGTTYHYRVVATTPDGTATGDDATFTTAPAPVLAPGAGGPLVQSLSVTRRFRAAGRGGSIVGAAAKVGGTVTYVLSGPATTRFTVQRALRGRRVGRRCVRPSKRNRGRRKCTRYARVRGSFTHAGKAGLNRFKFSGRIRRRKLRVASYRLVAAATDAGGNRSAAKRAKFKIVSR